MAADDQSPKDAVDPQPQGQGQPKLTKSGRPRRKPGPAKKGPARQAQQAKLAERRARAFALATSGATFDHIAKELDYADRNAAWKDVQAALKGIVQPKAEEYFTLEMQKLDRLEMQIMSRLMHKVQNPDGTWKPEAFNEINLKRLDRVFEIQRRRAKMLGLDAPQKHQVFGVDLTDAQLDSCSEQELAELRAGKIPERFTKGTNGVAGPSKPASPGGDPSS